MRRLPRVVARWTHGRDVSAVPAFTIRRATTRDAAALVQFAERLFRETFGPDNNVRDMEDYVAHAFTVDRQRAAIDSADSMVLVAEHRETLAAYAQLRIADVPATATADASVPSAEIERFYVDPQWHGNGLAADLMSEALREAAGRGARAVWLGVWERNARAIAFYRKAGFVEAGSQTFMLGSDAQRDLIMVRRIFALS